MHRPLLTAAAFAAAAVAAALVWLGPSPRESAAPPGRMLPAAGSPALVAAAPVAARALARAPVTLPGERAAVDFDATVARLVDLSMGALDAVARQDAASAQAADAEALTLVKAVLEHVPDYENRALFMLTGASGIDDARAAVTRGIAERFLHYGLQKHETGARAGHRGALDAFLAALLESIVPDQATATVVTGLLADQPYLGAAQEHLLMRFVELVPTYPWLVDPMRRLLLTLWRNLERSGVQPRDRLEALALALKDDSNPARRAAALEHLLVSGDRSLVEFVVQDIEDHRDARRASDLAPAAATKLDPKLALDVVRRLRAVSVRALTGPAIELARRDGAGVRALYERLLHASADAALRSDLVAGLGFHRSTENLATVQSAFERDPDPTVRRRALLALTANAASALGAQAVTAALSDRGLCGEHGERLGVVVAALENMASAGEAESVARLGLLLARRPDLPPLARKDLERLLQHGPRQVQPPSRSH